VDIFTLARRMGTGVKMIDQTYGHLITGADVHERELLDAYDEGQAAAFGHVLDTEGRARRGLSFPLETQKPRAEAIALVRIGCARCPAASRASRWDGSDGTRTRDLRRDRPAL
jgi:hypothetical protein